MSTEQTLVLVLYGLYLVDCVHWLRRGQVAYVRRSAQEWEAVTVERDSYTLLDRMPLLRNPFSTHAGLAIRESGSAEALRPAQLRGLEHRAKILAIVNACAGIYLLAVVPAMILLHKLLPYWRLLLATALLFHLLSIVEFVSCTGLWRRRDRAAFTQAVLSISLNPLAALRSADVVSNWRLGIRKP